MFIWKVSQRRHLNLLKNANNEKYGTLLWLLDHTHSAMGGRLLKQWIDQPLISKEKIEERLDLCRSIHG